MQKYTISEIERRFGYSNSKIRRLIKKNLLPITKEKRENRDVIMVLVEDEKSFRAKFGDYDYQVNEQFIQRGDYQDENQHTESVQEAEIIKDSTDYQLMSMEQKSFDQLIESIKNLADDRSKTEKEAYKKLEDQYFSLQQNYKIATDQIEKYKIETIQAQAELKIMELKVKEPEEKIKLLEENKRSLEEKINELKYTLSTKEKEYDNTVSSLKEELKNTKAALEDCQQQMQDVMVQKADLQGDLQDERETVARVTQQCNAAIEEAQEFEQKNQNLEQQIEELKKKKWWHLK